MWIAKPNKKDFKDPKQYEAAMAEFKKAMAEKKSKGRTFTSPTTEIENDPSWHGADTDFGKDVGSISFNHRVGTEFSHDVIDDGKHNDFTVTFSNEDAFDSEYGIVTIDLMSTLPKTTQDLYTSTILQQTMNKFNAQVRKNNAGAKNYEPVDLMIYNIAYSEAACFYAACCRIYGAVLNYEKRNAYFAEAYTRAVGGNYSDLKDKLPQFRAYLKSFASRLNGLTAVELPYFKRKVVLCSNTYKDEKDGYNCQIYVPRFRQWLIYEVDANKGSTLRSSNNTQYYTSWSDFSGDFENMTLAGIRELGDYMLNQLLTDADVSTMSGDILKRFEGTNAIVNLAWIDENYYVMPQYSDEFLEEFENCSMLLSATEVSNYFAGGMYDRGTPTGNSDEYYMNPNFGLSRAYFGEITQNNGQIVQVNKFETWADSVPGDYVIRKYIPRTINFKNGDVTPSRLITATRLLTTSYVHVSDEGEEAPYRYSIDFALRQCDTEMVLGMTVYVSVSDAALGNPKHFSVCGQCTDTHQEVVGRSNALAQFKFLPPLYTFVSSGTDPNLTYTIAGVIRNLDKCAVITTANIDGMITCSSIYEFGLDEQSNLNK